MFDFFISHSSIDKETIVENLVKSLKDRGYSVWYDKNEILVGDNILNLVQEGLKNSFCLLLILTDNFVSSKWTLYELAHFDALKDRRIIPIINNISAENKTQIFNILGNLKYIDMQKKNNEEIIGDLIYTLAKTKEENEQLLINDKLYELQRKLASYETINADLISIKLKEYIKLIDSHRDLLIVAAQKLLRSTIFSLLEHKGNKIKNTNIDNKQLFEMVVKENIGSINLQEYMKFIFDSSDDIISDDYIRIINHSLENILTYYVHTVYPIRPSFSQIEVVYPEDLTYSDFEDMYKIDKKVLRDDLIASVETAYSWYTYNNYTHVAVRDTKTQKIVGYFSALPLTDEAYKSVLDGTFMDKEFTIDSIKQYIFPDFYKLYIAAVAIDPLYQNTGAFIKLYNALIDIILILAKDRDIFISEVLAEASTKQGEKFCKMVGMNKIGHTESETDIYRIVTIPPQFRLNNQKGKELFKLCQEKFEEYRDFFEAPNQ